MNHRPSRAYENKLLLYSALDCHSNAALNERLVRAAAGVTRWDYVLKLLVHHGTLITFCRHVKKLRLDDLIPENVRENMRAQEAILRYRNKRFGDAIRSIADACLRHGVNAVFLKGALCVIDGYFPDESRFMSDIDLLVPADGLSGMTQVLSELNYVGIDAADNRERFRRKGELEFRHAADREILIEVSTILNKNEELAHCYPLNKIDLSGEIAPRRTRNQIYYGLRKEFHFAYCLFHHIALNYAYRLNWINDLFLMLNDPSLDRDTMVDYVRRAHLTKSFNLLILILTEHFQIPVNFHAARLPRRLERILLADSGDFVDWPTLETREAYIRFSLINTFWNKILFLARKIALTPAQLRFYYRLEKDDSLLLGYARHLFACAERFFKRRIHKNGRSADPQIF